MRVTGLPGWIILTVLLLFVGLKTSQSAEDAPYEMQLRSYELNEAGMLELYGKVENTSPKIIKYMYLKVLVYNMVGDLLAPTYGDVFIKLTGPVLSDEHFIVNGGTGTYYEPTENIDRVEVGVMAIEFMDGTQYEAVQDSATIINKTRTEAGSFSRMLVIIGTGTLLLLTTFVLAAL